MRSLSLTLLLGTLLLAGCTNSKWAFLHNRQDTPQVAGKNPASEDLVGYLNRNAEQT